MPQEKPISIDLARKASRYMLYNGCEPDRYNHDCIRALKAGQAESKRAGRLSAWLGSKQDAGSERSGQHDTVCI